MTRQRIAIRIVGAVQGVGFRPYVHRLATALGLVGFVRNDGDGVTIEAEGAPAAILALLERLPRDLPPAATLFALEHRFVVPEGDASFVIRDSERRGAPRVWVLPDLAICRDCAREIADPTDRRFRYPFANCTNCGPRFTIVVDLPYDRPRTAMRKFAMCPDCDREYRTVEDRRFHAQPIACPACGPSVRLSGRDFPEPLEADAAMRAAAAVVRAGGILALKGLGGYHLVVDAACERAAAELRARKRRSAKPFAVMYPELETLRRHVDVPEFAVPILQSAQAPILILPRTAPGYAEIAPAVAPHSPYLGVFLPYTPLHRVLLGDLGRPVVATSANVSDEPILFDDAAALRGLEGLADAVLTHDRAILRPADDSVLHVVRRPVPRAQVLRRARGYAPLPLLADRELPPILALGGHMNATFALSRGREIVLSQHFGDLEGFEGRSAYRRGVEDFLRLYGVAPVAVAHDRHPDYFTTGFAAELGVERVEVPHHHAHLAACLLENRAAGPALGLTWDGTGYGGDGTVWGGEVLLGDEAESRRVASLVPFRLPGGEAAVHDTWRTALALLHEAYDGAPPEVPSLRAIPESALRGVAQIITKNVHCPVTTSMGRLFDGVAAILGLALHNSHQAEAAQAVEYAAWRHGPTSAALPLPVVAGEDGLVRLDWRPCVRAIVEGLQAGTAAEALAAGFHHALVGSALEVARRVGERRVAMTGGVFCNRYLTEAMSVALEAGGFEPLIHSQLPPTDGSLSAGQLWAAAARLTRRGSS